MPAKNVSGGFSLKEAYKTSCLDLLLMMLVLILISTVFFRVSLQSPETCAKLPDEEEPEFDRNSLRFDLDAMLLRYE